jgi:recombination protein RecA
MYNEGISRAGDVLDLAVEMDVVAKRGSFYSYKDERLAQGRENSKAALRENPSLLREIENTVREANGLAPLPAMASEQTERTGQETIEGMPDR